MEHTDEEHEYMDRCITIFNLAAEEIAEKLGGKVVILPNKHSVIARYVVKEIPYRTWYGKDKIKTEILFWIDKGIYYDKFGQKEVRCTAQSNYEVLIGREVISKYLTELDAKVMYISKLEGSFLEHALRSE